MNSFIPFTLKCTTESSPKSYKISIFAQYERYIDKFKPSRSYLLAESMLFPVENNKKNPQYELEDLEVYDAISMIKFIKKHPVKAYYMDMHRLRYLYELDDCGSWIRKFIDDRKDDYRNYMEEYTYKHFQKMLRRLGRKGKIVAYYERDRLNEPPERINDDYYILCKDIKLNEKISKYVKKVKSKWYLQGTVFLSHNELNFYLDATDSYWEGELPAEDSQEYRDAIKDCMADLNEIKFSKGFIERMV